MPHADFVHLRVHSAYSLSEGAIKADKLAVLAKEALMPAVAITDSGNMFGALEFSQYCSGKGVQPIIGCQIAITREDNPRLPPDPVVLLAQNAEGYANLQRLSSAGFMETDPSLKPQLALSRVCERADGLILLTGGTNGPIARLLAEGQKGEAERLLARLTEAFPDRTVMELHRHGLPVERAIEPGLIALADAAGVPLVATNDCFFAKPEMYEAHDALLCIAEGRLLSERDRRRVTPEHWFKPAKVMRALFADLPEACDNTLAIARRCAVMAETRKPLLPVCPKVRPGRTEEETVRAMATEGLERRLDAMRADDETRTRYRERLAYELDVIAKMGFPGYFLIVADFIQWAKAHGIPVGPGRGSGAGSVAAWALTITDLDPLRFHLLFERFLNPERVSMPDFDIDFCQDRRDEVITYVRGEYGADRVAQIITFGKLQARAAVRDVGRVLGLPFGQVNKVAELIPNNPAKPVTLQQAIDGEPKLQQMRQDDEAVRRLLEIALQVEGLYRHASTHAAGVVIGDRTLTELVPIYRDPKSDFLVTQFSMKYVEQAGLVKFDFLGLTTLTILQRAVGFLHARGIEVDLAHLPLDDAPTYDMLQRGDAGGVFQFESQGMRDVLRQMRPDRFEDLIAAVALYRPGPMANIPAYCQRKQGEKWEAPHPEIRDILEETYGIMVYQEQVMQIAQKMAGYSLGGADLLRRAMGKKIRAEMEKQREIFVTGSTGRGIPAEKAEEVFDLMAKFADYGFNKSHAAAYALVAYQTAWLKANHPVAFLAACMSLAINNTDKLAALRQEATRLGIRVLPPDINRSGPDFTLEDDAEGKLCIRYALAAVKKVGMAAMQAVVAARGDRDFADLADFAARIDPKHLNRMQLENLVRAGAFDSLDKVRARVFGAAEMILRRAQSTAEERDSGQIGLFGGGGKAERLRLPDVAEWDPMDRLGYEADAIGFHLTAHPLDAYAAALRRLGAVPSNQLEQRAQAGAARVKVAGTVIGSKERITRTGSRMAWIRLSDGGGSYEVTFFSEVLARGRELLAAGSAVLVTADIRLEGEALRITAHDVAPLDAAAAQAGAGMRVWLSETGAVPHIRALLEREGKGKGRVVLVPRLDDSQDVEITLPGGFNVNPRLSQAMKGVAGVERVEDL
ncbi:DNA polymerase III subunit alpha [Rhodovastum atsumiense]|uniref:DNA polymerase III subunit alpha n=1 Tax=Rhodovastum atsumiense TaxID=504468 RepID=A0A5M6J462_9PROT|nr:DNA polymerase III subunit alpha [Rhodovastum atsumiense]KAA5614358.1 DNA polymerase III subunit alpha [Rhodovastum atsumiense]CAH2604831.1 DNA polymerase III subunit alpha [Rhodovastum atsumiense]